MRVAIPEWNGRVSPVFDVARSIRIFDVHDGTVTDVSNRRFTGDSRVAALVKLGVDFLICAAISTALESTLWVSGIEVIPDTCGAVEEIAAAFVAGDTELKKFRSPGSPCARRPSFVGSSHHRAGVRTRH